jgi:hypothetical protein
VPLLQLCEVLLERHLGKLEGHPPHAALQLGALIDRPQLGKLAKIDHGVPHA